MYGYIKEEILREDEFSKDDDFIKRAHYYFSKEGKKIRPTMIFMLAEALSNNQFIVRKEDIKKWAALIEMMHIASLAHDDIIDDSFAQGPWLEKFLETLKMK